MALARLPLRLKSLKDYKILDFPLLLLQVIHLEQGQYKQLEAHCENLGIRCISSQRGGDTAAIARDAIESAQAKGIDVVLVDTAGRMQNKTNLMNELNKVRRVANPHLTLFVGDSLAGNDAVEFKHECFQEIMKFDGAVLTKLDTDAKGGAGLSIALCNRSQSFSQVLAKDMMI